MKPIFVIVLLCSINLAVTQEYQVCYKASPENLAVPVRVLAGPSGKRGKAGPRGLKGVKGDMGATGECSCNLEDIAELKQSVKDLQDKVKEFQHYHADKISQCGVGMKNGRIPDSSITASTLLAGQYNVYIHHPQHGRLDNHPANGHIGAWATGDNSPGQWIQVDLGTPTLLKGIVTQGRQPRTFDQWITSYKISYGNSTASMEFIQENNEDMIFQGNTDTTNYKFNNFPEPIFAQYVRLVIHTYNGWATARLEFLTC